PDVPRVGGSGDPDGDLLSVLGMDASAREVRIRGVIGETGTWNLLQLLQLSWDWQTADRKRTAEQLVALGAPPEAEPRVVKATFSQGAPRFFGPFVQSGPLSETEPLADNYIHWLRSASVSDLRDEKTPFTATPDALLYKLLRHAALSDVFRAAIVQL